MSRREASDLADHIETEGWRIYSLGWILIDNQECWYVEASYDPLWGKFISKEQFGTTQGRTNNDS